MSGLWCVNAGYGRKELADAAYQQLMTLPYYNSFFQTTNVPAVQLAAKLASLAPVVGGRRFEHVFFSSSGSESNDTNVRMARRYWDLLGQPQRKVIISRHNAYHGSTMAGASLGAITSKFPAWNQAFWEHLDVAISLHHIHKVMILDHRDCGAYKVVLGEDFGKLPEKETQVHAETLMALRKQILAKYPQLAVETYLMALDGSVQQVLPKA